MNPKVADALMQSDSEDAWDVFQDESAFLWVDWKEWGEGIVLSCETILKSGKLSCEHDDDEEANPRCHIDFGSRRSSFSVTKDIFDNQCATLDGLNQVLAPDYEIRFCTDSEGSDTFVLLLLKSSDWTALENRYGEELGKRFLAFAKDLDLFKSYSSSEAVEPLTAASPSAALAPPRSPASPVRVLGLPPGPPPRQASYSQWFAMAPPRTRFFAFFIPIVLAALVVASFFTSMIVVQAFAVALALGGTMAAWRYPLRFRKLARNGLPVLGVVDSFKLERGQLVLRFNYVVGEWKHSALVLPEKRPKGAKDVDMRVWLLVDSEDPGFCGTWEFMKVGDATPTEAAPAAVAPPTPVTSGSKQSAAPNSSHETPKKKTRRPVAMPVRLNPPVTVDKPDTSGVRQKYLARAIKDLYQWCACDPAHYVSAIDRVDLDDADASATSINRTGFSNAVYYIQNCLGKLGQLDVLTGHADGWEWINRSALYRYWGLRLSMGRVNSSHGAQADGEQLHARVVTAWAHLYCYGILTGLKEIEDRAAVILLEIESDSSNISSDSWPQRRFEPFVLRLLLMDRGLPAPDSLVSRSLGVYDAILANWSDADKLVTPLLEACDYHCWNLEERSYDWEPEFEHAPFHIIPTEILTIRALRERKGLETPTINHPLMQTPLADFSTRGAGVEDDIVKGLRKALLVAFGES
ncbi:MAG TPA: hypothetical protein P5081_04550 [Phycisphaerae bacterium]|nr:hypothetical protein [Phycisphaerae bacterium]HRW52132.1 hypothetical protein [Phycisphaerae bacterium]